MATLRNLAITIPRLAGHASIAAANRHHVRDRNARSSCFRQRERTYSEVL
jgi:hypothetical protein